MTTGRFTLRDEFGPIPAREYDKLPHAMHAARERMRAWARPVAVVGSKYEWIHSPRKEVVKRPIGRDGES